MPTFNLKEYSENKSDAKKKVFVKFLYLLADLPIDSDDFDNEYLALLTEDELIKSLQFYISENGITSQQSARDYIAYLTTFFTNLSRINGIRNNIFCDIDLNAKFLERASIIVSKLKQTESRNAATDEQYEKLVEYLDEFLLEHKHIESELFADVNKFKTTGKGHLIVYPRFVSVIAIKVLLRFALKDLAVVSLTINDLNIDNKTLCINGIYMPLGEELTRLFRQYLIVRKYVLEDSTSKEDKLFICYNGLPYLRPTIDRNSNSSYSMLFKMMNRAIKTVSTEIFTTRTVKNWLRDGMSVSLVSKITGFSSITCLKIQEEVDDENSSIEKLQQILENKVVVEKKKPFICPVCGNEARKADDDWTLIRFEDTIFYINKKEIINDSEHKSINDLDEKINLKLGQDLDEDIDVPSNETVEARTSRIKRYQNLVNKLKNIYDYKCQLCNDSFSMDNGKEYCEAHHIKELANGGTQGPENVIIVCPKHHRMFHYAKKSISIGKLIDGKRVLKIGGEEFIIPFDTNL